MSSTDSSKRPRELYPDSPISPENKKANMERSVGEMKLSELKSVLAEIMQVEMERVLEGKLVYLAKKSDVDDIKTEIEELKNKVESLTEINNRQARELENIRQHNRQKSIVIRGLPIADKKSAKTTVTSFLQQTLKVNQQLSIVDAYLIGKTSQTGNRACIVEFGSVDVIHAIFKNIKNLQGSRVSIERDWTVEQRKKKNILLKIRRELYDRDVNSNRLKVKLSGLRLFVNDNCFTWRDGNIIFDNSNGISKLQEVTGFDLGNFIQNIEQETTKAQENKLSEF